MTLLYSYDFENGTNGSNVTVGLSGASTITGGSAFTYSNAHVRSGGGRTLAGRIATTGLTSTMRAIFSAPVNQCWSRFYCYVETVPSATTAIFTSFDGTVSMSECRLTNTGAIQLRNNNTQFAISPTGLVTAGTFIRIEYYFSGNPGLQQARVFVGANVDGTVPDYDSGQWTTATNNSMAGFTLGVINGATATLHFDQIANDDANWPGQSGLLTATAEANVGGSTSQTEFGLLAATGEATVSLTTLDTIAPALAATGSATVSLTPVKTISPALAATGAASVSMTPLHTVPQALAVTASATATVAGVYTPSNTTLTPTAAATVALTASKTVIKALAATAGASVSLTPLKTSTSTLAATAAALVSVISGSHTDVSLLVATALALVGVSADTAHVPMHLAVRVLVVRQIAMAHLMVPSPLGATLAKGSVSATVAKT